MSWATHHSQSEKSASQAEAAFKKGDKARAMDFYRLSAEAEERALNELDPGKTRTLGITAVSAASLWFKAKEFKHAEQIAYGWLASNLLPDFATAQLQELLQTLWHERSFQQAKINFVQGRITISLAGGEVSMGAAPLSLIHQKANEVCNFFYRIIEMLLGHPFRKRGTLDSYILDHFRPWIFQAPPGSYRFAVRLEKPAQMTLFETTPEIEDVTRKFMHIVRTVIHEPPESLSQAVSSPEYRSGFLKMSRNLAPTGKTFNRLEIESTHDSDTLPIIIYPDSRELLTRMIRSEWQRTSKESQDLSIRGVLRALHLERDWLEVRSDEDTPIRIHRTGEIIDDIVGPMVNRRVIVTVTYNARNGRYLYRDIQLEE